MQKKNLKEQGFTIIEVLIVLAIAALIMLVVFLAVPALRRNAANSGRANDAAVVIAAAAIVLRHRDGWGESGKRKACHEHLLFHKISLFT